MKFEVKKSEKIYKGFLDVNRVAYKFEKFDGTMSEGEVEIVNRPEAVAVVLRDCSTDEFICIKQLRVPTHKKGKPWLIEIAAGLIEPGETPEISARREVKEELGYELGELKKITSFFSSPGYTDELIHLYYAEISEEDKVEEGGGNEDENEDIDTIRIPTYAIEKHIKEENIRDAKTIIGLSLVAQGI